MERLKRIKDCLIDCVEEELHENLETVDTKELGEVIDMIKDIAETMYYCEKAKKIAGDELEHKEHDAVEAKHHYMNQTSIINKSV